MNWNNMLAACAVGFAVVWMVIAILQMMRIRACKRRGWLECPICGRDLHRSVVLANSAYCPKCQYHYELKEWGR